MKELSRMEAFTSALNQLKNADGRRLPRLEFCTVRQTAAGGKILDLYGAKGKAGKICGIWMTGPLAGQLTKRQLHAANKLKKMQLTDYAHHLTQAKSAGQRCDDLAQNRELRSAIRCLYAYFEGEIRVLCRKLQKTGMRPNDSGLAGKVRDLSKHTREHFKVAVPFPKLRTWPIRDVISHIEIQKNDPIEPSRTISAVDATQAMPSVAELEADKAVIDDLLNQYWKAFRRWERHHPLAVPSQMKNRL